MSELKTYSFYDLIDHDAIADELLDDLQVIHDCQEIIENKHKEALRAVRKRFESLSSISGLKRETLLSELEETFRDHHRDAFGDTLDHWSIEMKNKVEDMGEVV